MRLLTTILFLFITFNSFGQNFYISSSAGNDNWVGTKIDSPWRSLAKLNASILSRVAGGDSILFRRGDTFRGQLWMQASGDPTHRITVGAYGTGAKPIISGLFTLDGWTANGTNKWVCTPDSVMKANCNVFTINGVPQAVARTPWIYYDSSKATSGSAAWVMDASLSGSNWTGGEVVIRLNTFVAAKGTITSQVGTKINFANTTQSIYNGQLQNLQNGTNNMGFFIQRHLSAMDSQGEWYFNKGTNTMNLYSTSNPNSQTIKASYVDTVLKLESRGYITIRDLEIEGAGLLGIESYAGTALIVDNCTFNNNTKPIYVWNTPDTRIVNNTVNNSFQGAIFVRNNQAKRMMVDSNYVTNTGQLFGMGIYNNEFSLRGIVSMTDSTRAQNFNYVIGNTIINTGDGPIYLQGSNILCRRNVIDTFANQIDDMGGIYLFNFNTAVATIQNFNRVIDSNFISNAIGAPAGSKGGTNVDVAGLYFDDQTNNVYAAHNTIYNIPGNGIQMNTPNAITLRDNTVFNCSYIVSENHRQYGSISKVKITKNVFCQTGTNQQLFNHVNDSTGYQTATQCIQNLALIDSNWLTNLATNSYQAITKPWGGSYTTTNINLATWKSTYGHDLVSILPPVTVTTTNTHLYTNKTNALLRVPFATARKKDLRGNTYDNYADIPAYSSLVLIDNGAAPNQPPVADAGIDQTKTLPANTATLSGIGTDPENAALNYLWTKTSGPLSGTITSPGSATTGLTGLVQGIYIFTLTVSDPLGAQGSDDMILTVSAAPNTAPVVDAGVDQEIGLPLNHVSLVGSATDAEGGALTYQWTKIGGTGTVYTITSPNTANTTITGMGQGTYDFDLAATDNGSLVGHDAVHILVDPTPLPPNQYPVSNAGTNADITLPANSVSLNGTSSYDPDGTINSYTWSVLSGPGGSVFSSTTSATPTLSNLSAGTYNVQLVVKDNSDSLGSATMTIVVHSQPANMPPRAEAGNDQVKRLPDNTTSLVGIGTDTDGNIVSYSWKKVGDLPSGGNLSTPNAASTDVTNLHAGTYYFQLTVKDNQDSVSTDIVAVTVGAENSDPSAVAGGDIEIKLPRDSVILSGSGTDVDGYIGSYQWVKVAGSPAGGVIASPASALTKVAGLKQGRYTYQLTVTDNEGATGSNVMHIIVSPSGGVPLNGIYIKTNNNPEP